MSLRFLASLSRLFRCGGVPSPVFPAGPGGGGSSGGGPAGGGWRARAVRAGLAGAVLAGLAGPVAAVALRPFAWVEGEAPDAGAPPHVTPDMGQPGLLAGGRLLMVSIEAGQMEARVPVDGLVFAYTLQVPQAGRYELWNRVGFESVASPFEWRIDGGPWRPVVINPKEPGVTGATYTIDVVELGFWQPIAWAPLGALDLPAGPRKLEIRIPRAYAEKDGRKAPERVMYASDAICLYGGTFHPVHHRRPDDTSWRTAEDVRAESQVFRLPAQLPAAGERSTALLRGGWQYAPWDERGPIVDRTGPVAALPEDLDYLPWSSLAVPGDRNVLKPSHLFNHRYLLRTRVEVPASHAGRAFVLEAPCVSFIPTLFVDGRRVGHFDLPHGHWRVDLTPFLEPGKTHQIVVAMKDSFYAYAGEEEGGLRTIFYMPMSLFGQNQGVTMRFDYPVKGHDQNGFLDEVRLHSLSPVHVEDAFVRTSVKDRTLAVDYTVRNAGAQEVEVVLAGQARERASGETRLTLPRATVRVPAGGTATVTARAAWPDARLWWPFEPFLYDLRTETLRGAERIDVHGVRFGFREWEVRGPAWYLNGVRQQLRAGLDHYGEPHRDGLEATVEDWRRIGQNMFRLRFQFPWGGKTYREVVEWMDEVGMPLRYAASTFDGQHASYRLAQDGRPHAVLFENWRRQLANRVLHNRNAPSIFVWELDNEIVYINSRNFGTLAAVEPEFTKASEMIRGLDPTRVTVSGGGSALRDRSLPTYGVHYFETDDRDYPDEAYTLERAVAAQGQSNWDPWPMEYGDRPLFMSETAFLPGRQPADFAAFGGEAAFLGRAETAPAAARYARWLSEGYRWKGVGGFHFWFDGATTGGGHFVSWQPVGLYCREWDGTFASREKVARTLRLFNDTREAAVLEAGWELRVENRRVGGARQSFTVPAGESVEWPVTLDMPFVRGAEAVAADFALTVRRENREIFRDVRPLRVLNPEAGPRIPLGPGELLVWDLDGAVTQFLRAREVRFTPVAGVDALPAPETWKVLVVGRDALTPALATDPRWLELAAAGKRIVVLEQRHPLHYQAVPADFEVRDWTGRVAFIENPAHPVFAGLTDADFLTWPGDHVVYRSAYEKASRGAKSLLHADRQLAASLLAACEVGDGLLLLNQTATQEKLHLSVVAQRFLLNLLAYAATHEVKRFPVVSTLAEDSGAGRFVAGLGLRLETAGTTGYEVATAVRAEEPRIVLVDGTNPYAVEALATARRDVEALGAKGGWVMVMGMTEAALPHFNRLVGVEHLFRPFRMEKVTLAPVRDPLTAGLSLRDVVMYSGERLYGHAADLFYSGTAFGGVVDLDDIAPFAAWPGPAYFNDPAVAGPGSDTWPLNMVNGIEGTESWKYVFSIHLASGDPSRWEIVLPREEEVTTFSIAPNTIYHELRKVRLTFDGGAAPAQEFEFTPGATGRQDFTLRPAQRVTRLGIELAEWEPKGRADVIGVDNIWIRVRRPDDFRDRVRPLLNIGGLVRYPMGTGGVLLNTLAFPETEEVPVNGQKKRTIVATILRNMGAGFTGAGTLVPGAGQAYVPVPLDQVANLYLTRERGFPGEGPDLGAFPVGPQRFAGIGFEVRDFRTSPLESGVALRGRAPFGGDRFPEEAVIDLGGRRADTLAFVHTLVPGDDWRPRREGDEPPAAFVYRVTWADGETADIPVRRGRAVEGYVTDAPAGLRDAALAWAAPAGDGGGRSVAAWQFTWTNPRPDQPLRAVTLRRGDGNGRWGTPILLALSAGRREVP